MITRAQIRRQLRKNGGVMNAVPRQQYGLGSIFKSITKPIKKAISSPVGKAALLGLGAYGLGGGFGSQGFGLGNIGPQIGRGLSAIKSGLFGAPAGMSAGPMSYLQKGVTPFSKGILGKLGLTGGGGKMMPTALGGITGASLLTYFMSKGATEEEAEELAQDVYRGKGLGMDQIRADMKNYRSGALSGSQAYDKGYHFLTPQTYLGAQGGRVGLYAGTPKEGIKSLEAGASSIKVEGDVRPENMKMAGEIPSSKVLESEDYIIDMEESMALFGLYPYQLSEEMQKELYGKTKYAQGGRVGLANGSEGVKQMYVSDDLGALPKSEGGVLPKDVGKLSIDDFDSIEDYRRYIKYLKKTKKAKGGRIGKYGGGIGAAMPRIPTGMPRTNAGGITELDYRQEGGFVPVGVKEKADDVPAMLSKNEFVMTADAVKAAGDGSVEKGAQRMYDTMKRLEGRVA